MAPAPPPAPTAAPQLPSQDLHDLLRARLVQSGEYSRIMDALRAKLDAARWEDSVRDAAREKARAQDPPSLQALVAELEPQALGMIPAEARAEVEAMVRAFVEKSVE
ncbi:transcription factor e(y)2-domain-containing protein [Rhodotorula diobovata]|uniref:Transcription and mRNA export factor SUS1 n=1 Tax=Rhodotorula diobovata TaxID=5288 RepID=A0A5C5FY02_9BASI|nr:transcription factor e(y)2-domain-containing protein [Rhodotorula diobovata]